MRNGWHHSRFASSDPIRPNDGLRLQSNMNPRAPLVQRGGVIKWRWDKPRERWMDDDLATASLPANGPKNAHPENIPVQIQKSLPSFVNSVLKPLANSLPLLMSSLLSTSLLGYTPSMMTSQTRTAWWIVRCYDPKLFDLLLNSLSFKALALIYYLGLDLLPCILTACSLLPMLNRRLLRARKFPVFAFVLFLSIKFSHAFSNMHLILRSLSIFVFLSTVISDDTSLFSDIEPYSYDLGFSDDQSLWNDDSPPGESMFDEASPQLLSLDECSSGDLGLAGDLGFTSKRRRGNTCRSETKGSTQTPTEPDPEETPPDNQNNNGPDPLDFFPYMPPPEFDGLGCPSLWGKVFKYTVCGSAVRNDQTRSEILDVLLPSFTVTNAELSKRPTF